MSCINNLLNLKKEKLLSLKECYDIIEKNFNNKQFHIINYLIKKANEQVLGFLADYFHLIIFFKLKNQDDVIEANYFLKSLPLNNPEKRAMIEKYGLFWKEIQIYKHLFICFNGNKITSQWHPYCYLIRDDLIILEDLTYKGYKLIGEREELSTEHINCVLRSMARMHADSLEIEFNQFDGKRLDQVFGNFLFETIRPDNTWLMAGLRATIAIALQHPKYKEGTILYKRLRAGLLKAQMELFERINNINSYQNVITNRDLWKNNLLFKYLDNKPINCILLDYQLARYLPPALDLLNCLYFITIKSQRNTNDINEFIKNYYNYLSNELKLYKLNIDIIIPWFEFLNTINYYKLIALILNCIYVPLTNLPTGLLNNIQKSNQNHYNYICNVDRDDFILNYIKTDDYYCNAIYDTIDELIEYFVDNQLI